MTLKAKFRVMLAVSAAGLLAVAGFWIQGQHSSLLSEKRQKTKNLVEVPYSIIERQYRLETEGPTRVPKFHAHAGRVGWLAPECYRL